MLLMLQPIHPKFLPGFAVANKFLSNLYVTGLTTDNNIALYFQHFQCHLPERNVSTVVCTMAILLWSH